MSDLTNVLNKIVAEIKADESALETMIVQTAKDAYAKIVPAIWKAVGDAVAAAESAAASSTLTDPLDKAEFAFSNAVAALTRDGIAFAESEINYAMETFVQARNAALAAA